MDSLFPPGGGGMFENENFTPPLGDYPTRDRPAAGFAEAERTSEEGTGAGVSPENGRGQNAPSTARPAPLSAEWEQNYSDKPERLSDDDDAKLRAMVTKLRWQQPEEWDQETRLRRMEAEIAGLTAVLEMLTESHLRLAKKANV